MTGTKRIYNKPSSFIFKKHAKSNPNVYYETDDGQLVNRQNTDLFIINIVERNHLLWLQHGTLCMGHCLFCKDRKRDQLVKTRKQKAIHFDLA
jgi:hypothetical protein